MAEVKEEKWTLNGKEATIRYSPHGRSALVRDAAGEGIGWAGPVAKTDANPERPATCTEKGYDYTPFTTIEEGVALLKARLQAEAAQ